MAYEKQEWADDDTTKGKVTATRMTHIENGIYDNSLATDKINPSGTATTSAEIEEGQINDVIGFKSLKLKGQTSQYTTTGSQLFDINNTPSANKQYVINNGFKLTKGTNRTIQISLPNPIPAGTYYISADVTNSTLSGNNKINVSFKDANNTDVVGNVTFLTNGAVTTTAEAKDLYFFIASNEANTATITLDNIMLNSGSTKKDFEKYTGGKASPNPDFPQDVNNVSGYNVVEISNKNLIDELFRQGSASTLTDTKNIFNKNNKLLKAGTYTFSTNLPNTMKFAIFGNTQKFPTANTVTYNSAFKNNITQFTFTFSQDLYLGLMIAKTDNSAITPNDISTYHFQIEQNNSATSFVAHQGNNFDIDLPVENLFFLPNATITNGIEYTINNDGTFNVYGTASANTTISLLKDLTLTKIKANNYAFSVNQTLPVGVEIRVEGFNGNTWKRHLGGSPLNSSNSIKNGTADLTDVNKIRTSIYVPSGKSVDMKNVAVQFEEGSVINSFTPYGTNPIELCKIGTYQDYIFKKDGKWWKHNAIGKIVLNGTEAWTAVSTNTSEKYRPQINLSSIVSANLVKPSSNTEVGLILSDHFKAIIAGKAGTFGGYEGMSLDLSGYMQIYDDDYNTNDVSLFKTWLSNNNINLYWVYATPIDEEITYAPLLRQLDELYNSGLYDVTNISQDNSSEAFVLDIEACKNNINGIVEYIRR